MRLIDADAFKESILAQSNTGYENYSTELICDFVDEFPTINNKEIRDKVIEEFKSTLLKQKVIDKSMVRRIAEQMKEVGE